MGEIDKKETISELLFSVHGMLMELFTEERSLEYLSLANKIRDINERISKIN